MSTELRLRIVRSRRRTLALTVRNDASVEVRAPLAVSEREIRRFVSEHRDWIEKQLEKVRMQAERQKQIPTLSQEELEALAKAARLDLPERVRRFAPQVGVSYGRITIRNQKSKWGSCSTRGNLNFNCMLMLAPEAVRDYIVVHELCHRKEMNHSPRFWAEVERTLPDYRSSRDWLKKHGTELMLQNPHAREST